jgi:hypothetical protein
MERAAFCFVNAGSGPLHIIPRLSAAGPLPFRLTTPAPVTPAFRPQAGQPDTGCQTITAMLSAKQRQELDPMAWKLSPGALF